MSMSWLNLRFLGHATEVFISAAWVRTLWGTCFGAFTHLFCTQVWEPARALPPPSFFPSWDGVFYSRSSEMLQLLETLFSSSARPLAPALWLSIFPASERLWESSLCSSDSHPPPPRVLGSLTLVIWWAMLLLLQTSLLSASNGFFQLSGHRPWLVFGESLCRCWP